MRQHTLVFTMCAFILANGATSAAAQQGPGSPMMQQPTQEQTQQQGLGHESMTGQRGMMGRGMMGMMGQRGMDRGRAGHALMPRIMFILMDTNGDGIISLQEFLAAHERIFKAMDLNKDGGLTFEEMQAFMHGSSMPQQ